MGHLSLIETNNDRVPFLLTIVLSTSGNIIGLSMTRLPNPMTYCMMNSGTHRTREVTHHVCNIG